jgi:catechol 2,3-dioxygenase-like lactoylglutathione lyase family enzyme
MVRFERSTPRLPVADMPATLEFYRDILSFRVDVRWPDERPSFVVLERGGARVAFFTSEEDARDVATGRGPELYIDVTDAQALHDRLISRVEIEWGPEVYSYGCLEFAVSDPDGYLVIFTEGTDREPTTDEPSSKDGA